MNTTEPDLGSRCELSELNDCDRVVSMESHEVYR